MRCHHCGNENPDSNKFCGGCGTRLTKPVPNFTLGTQHTSFLSSGGTVFATTLPQSGTSLHVNEEQPATTSQHLGTAEVVEVTPEAEPSGNELPAERIASHGDRCISGPSFLGLTNAPDNEGEYLLLDESRGSRKGWYLVFLLVIAAVIAVGWFEWKKMNTPVIPVSAPPQSQAQPPAANASRQPPASANSQLPQSDNTGERFTTVDPSVKNWGGASDISSDADEAKQDPTATRSDMTRQAHDAAKRRSDEKKQQETKPQPAKVKPMADKQPAPQQNRLLLLGEKYLYGHGDTARNCQQAMVYFRAAAEEDNVPAMSHLAALYGSGECAKRDPAQAYSWLKRAHDADPGNCCIISMSCSIHWFPGSASCARLSHE